MSIASNRDNPSFSLAICRNDESMSNSKTYRHFDHIKKYKVQISTQNPAVLKNKSSMEYVNQLCNGYPFDMDNLRRFDLQKQELGI